MWSIYTHMYTYTEIYIYIYIVLQTHMNILFQRVVSHIHNPALRKPAMRRTPCWISQLLYELLELSIYIAHCPNLAPTLLAPPAPNRTRAPLPLREQAGRTNAAMLFAHRRSQSYREGHNNRRTPPFMGTPITSRGYTQIGDSSALRRRSQSDREGCTQLAIAPPCMGFPTHTERGTQRWR